MKVRISHCSTSLENYYICLNEKVAGFINRGPQPDDLIYLVVKVGKKSFCGARFILDEPTDYKPWADAESYVNALSMGENSVNAIHYPRVVILFLPSQHLYHKVFLINNFSCCRVFYPSVIFYQLKPLTTIQ